jgi:hypothetical protein
MWHAHVHSLLAAPGREVADIFNDGANFVPCSALGHLRGYAMHGAQHAIMNRNNWNMLSKQMSYLKLFMRKDA